MALSLNRTVGRPLRLPAAPHRMSSSRLCMRAKPSVHEAAEALAQAAIESAGTGDMRRIAASTQATAARLETMQAAFSASLEVQKSCMESQKAMQAKLDSMQAKLDALERAAVQQTLLSAWDRSTLREFEYTWDGPAKSGGIVKQVLESFMQGRGIWIFDSQCIGTSDKAGRAKFREKLTEQILTLTGVKPRWEEELNSVKKMQWAIKRK